MEGNVHKIIEDKIIDLISMETGGRIVAYKPEKGFDLVIEKKGEYLGEDKVLLNVEDFVIPPHNNVFSKNLLQDKISDEDSYLLFVIFNKASQNLEDKLWLVPCKHLKEKNIFEFNSEKFSEYSFGKKELLEFFIKKLITNFKPGEKEEFTSRHY